MKNIMLVIAALLGMLLVYPIRDFNRARRCAKAGEIDTCVAFHCCSWLGFIAAFFFILSIFAGFLGHEYSRALWASGIVYVLAFIMQLRLNAPAEAPYQRPTA